MSKDAGCVKINCLFFFNLVHDLEKFTTVQHQDFGVDTVDPSVALHSRVALCVSAAKQKSLTTPDSGDAFNKLRPPGQDTPPAVGSCFARPSSCFSN